MDKEPPEDLEGRVETGEEPDAIVLAGVRCTTDGIELWDGDRILKHVPRGELQKIELRHGFLSQHPIVQIALGGGIAWLGLGPAEEVLRWFREGGTMIDLLAWFVLLVPAGVWVIYDALRRGHYLSVRARKESLRFVLKGNPDDVRLAEFLDRARALLGPGISITSYRVTG